MAPKIVQSLSADVWALARRQHGVVARTQLLTLGVNEAAIKHRLAIGRLHAVVRGVYAIGRPELAQHGRWMAAVLCCGPSAALSHGSAATAWGIRRDHHGPIEVSVPVGANPRPPGIRVHRRTRLTSQGLSRLRGIPLTTPAQTLVDLAVRLSRAELEAAVNEADKHGLIGSEELRTYLRKCAGLPGVGVLRRILDRDTFVLTDSELERRLLPIARSAGLPQPLTGQRLNGYKVDFFWPDLGLVVETDGLRYHRTPTQQARDRRRDQAHTAAGLTQLRFTHGQVRFEPDRVQRILVAAAARLRGGRAA